MGSCGQGDEGVGTGSAAGAFGDVDEGWVAGLFPIYHHAGGGDHVVVDKVGCGT